MSSDYTLELKSGITFSRQTVFISAFNNGRACSANGFTFPLCKSLTFTLGTIDSYLNDPAPAVPPITPNLFQFISGVTCNIKSRY